MDENALVVLRGRFLEQNPDFRRFGQPGNFESDNADKRQLIAGMTGILMDRAQSEPAVGALVLDLISGHGGVVTEVLHGRMCTGLRRRHEDHPGVLEAAAGALVLSADPVAAVDDFCGTATGPALVGGREAARGERLR
jgi:hypothetical protein